MSQYGARDLAGNVQIQFGPAAKERNWSLYLFFRILTNDELQRLNDEKLAAKARQDKLEVDQAVKLARAAVDAEDVSAHRFAKVAEELSDSPNKLTGRPGAPFLAFLQKLFGDEPQAGARVPLDTVKKPGQSLPNLGGNALDNANECFRQGLFGICYHEFLRYERVDGALPRKRSLLRSDAERSSASTYSDAAVSIAFTHSGLAAIRKVENNTETALISREVLASFPEAFRHGMAARAERLGDVGPSAPENWDGELGKRSVHGLLSAYFPVSELRHDYWDRLRREVAAFNDGDEALRQALALLFRPFGFELEHIEFGEAPYELEGEPGAQTIKQLPHRYEHFGFRDGISQPFIDLGLKTPLPGGGRPAKDGSWAPVAAGEIFLGPPDEDGLTADQPANATLRDGGTYLVFRKLEQDVTGFRNFLKRERDSVEEQELLAAQIVGRWRSGAPLAKHPHSDASYLGPKAEKTLNDFRYHSEDPDGQKCPIGSHIRRSNPRDTGGRDEVKRHRILRRGMSYGGPLLPNHSAGDGRHRGMHFIAANARLELQFELIQRDWINSGELLGQVGAGRCPLIGANKATQQDQFLEAGAAAPISSMPTFVTTKGGDYFFMPSIAALRMLADGKHVEVNTPLPFGRYSASRAETPSLLSETRLKSYGARLLMRRDNAIRLELPATYREYETADQSKQRGERFVFVGQHADVVRVLKGDADGECPAHGGAAAPRAFSVAHYHQASRQITRGEDLLLSMDPDGPLDEKRRRRLEILHHAWQAQSWTDLSNGELRGFVRETADRVVHRFAQTGRIDLLQDLAFYLPYQILKTFIGLPGPNRLSELVVALPFAKRYLTEIPPEWLRGRQNGSISEPDYATTQMWSRFAFGEVIGNILDRRELTETAIQATSEIFTHIDERLMEERLREILPGRAPATLLEQFVRQKNDFIRPDTDEIAYFGEVRALLADLMVTLSMNIALPFSKALQAVLAFGFDPSKLIPTLDALPHPDGPDNVERFAYELLRLNPSAPAIFRRCETKTKLPSGAVIEEGEWVGCLLPVAGRDPAGPFLEPHKFSLGDHLPPPLGGPKRDPKDYLLFGPYGGVHRCWGELLGRMMLGELFRATAKFKGLTGVAGPMGEVQEFPPRMDFGLKLKFHPFDPNRSGG